MKTYIEGENCNSFEAESEPPFFDAFFLLDDKFIKHLHP